MPNQTKDAMRRQMLAQLAGTASAERQMFSDDICRKLVALPIVRHAQTIALFAPLKSEPDLLPLFVQQESTVPGCRLLFPRIDLRSDSAHMDFYQVSDWSELVPRVLGIREPLPDIHPLVSPEEIDVILVPGLAFDPITGARLGRGGGYYDRFLARLPQFTQRIGICFPFQLIPGIPTEPHDVAVHQIIC